MLTIANFNTTSIIFAIAQIIAPLVLVFGLDVLFIKLGWYKPEDLKLDASL